MLTRYRFDGLSESQKLDLWNEHMDGYERIWVDESWDTILDDLGWTPVETLRAAVFGVVDWQATYVWVDAYGNLQTSFRIVHTPYDEDTLWDELVDIGEAVEDDDENPED